VFALVAAALGAWLPARQAAGAAPPARRRARPRPTAAE
jgi:hypothetical protein